jgi:hypothetical protein
VINLSTTQYEKQKKDHVMPVYLTAKEHDFVRSRHIDLQAAVRKLVDGLIEQAESGDSE